MKAKGKCGVTLDDYMDFLENPHAHDLANAHLNQIVTMHGFKKIHHRPKKFLVDTLNTMDLISPHRSTLKDVVISSCASLSADELVRDLDVLQWQECSLQSIHSVNSSIQADLQRSCLSGDETSQNRQRQRRRRRRRRSRKSASLKALDDLVTAANSVSSYWLRL